MRTLPKLSKAFFRHLKQPCLGRRGGSDYITATTKQFFAYGKFWDFCELTVQAFALVLGIILLILGSTLMIMEPTTYQVPYQVPYTDTVTSDKSSPILSSQTYTVQPQDYWYIYESVDLSGKDPGTVHIQGSFSFISPTSDPFSGGYDFAFYLFDSANYAQWEQGSSSTSLKKLTKSNYSVSLHACYFDVALSHSDTYYLVFDNTAQSVSRTFMVTANLVWKLTENVTKYRTEYYTMYDYTRSLTGLVIATTGLMCTIAGAAMKT